MSEKPYVPKYKGFDDKATENAQATVDRANENPSGLGEDTNATYMDDGPKEYERRTGKKMR